MIKIKIKLVLLVVLISCNSPNFNNEYTFNNSEGELVFSDDFTSFVTLDFADQEITDKQIIRISFFKTDSVSKARLLAENNEQDIIDSLTTMGLLVELDFSNTELDLSTSQKLKEVIFIYDNSYLRELNFSETYIQFVNGQYLITDLGIYIQQEDL